MYKDVKLVVRPYKTRDAFTNLSSSPPTIYLNEYLIDDDEAVEYLILRELIHIALHRYRSRYTGGLTYAEKFDSILNFLIPKEKVEEIRGKDGKADRDEPEASVTSFSSILWGPLRAPQRAPPVIWTRDGEKEVYPPASTSLQVFVHRHNYACESVPVGEYLQGSLGASTLLAGFSSQGRTYRTNLSCESTPVGKYLQVSTPQTFPPHSGRSPLSWRRCQVDVTVVKECD